MPGRAEDSDPDAAPPRNTSPSLSVSRALSALAQCCTLAGFRGLAAAVHGALALLGGYDCGTQVLAPRVPCAWRWMASAPPVDAI